MKNRPIGIFDSGIGGLTVVKELVKILPNEDIIYFGDTGRVPYGNRGKDIIVKYSIQDIKFLLSKDVKILVSACGTASTHISLNIVSNFGVAYTGVLYPCVKKACDITKTKSIGVIGTNASISSGKYKEMIKRIDPDIDVISVACPLFVPLVENGFFDDENEVTKLVAKGYLKPFIDKVDVLILGCTHYPIIKNIIGNILGKDIILVDSGEETARYIREILTNENILNESSDKSILKFYSSDDVELFSKSANLFLDSKICEYVEYVDIERYSDTIKKL